MKKILSLLFILFFSVSCFCATDWNRCVRDGVLTETKMMLKSGADSGTTLVIDSGAITVNASYIIIDTENNAATDTLSTLNVAIAEGRYSSVRDGDLVVLRQELASQDVTIDANGNCDLGGYTSIVLSSLSNRAIFQYDEALSLWSLIAFTNSDGIEGQAINNSPIGATTPSTGAFTTITATTANITNLDISTPNMTFNPITTSNATLTTGNINILFKMSDGTIYYVKASTGE